MMKNFCLLIVNQSHKQGTVAIQQKVQRSLGHQWEKFPTFGVVTSIKFDITGFWCCKFACTLVAMVFSNFGGKILLYTAHFALYKYNSNQVALASFPGSHSITCITAVLQAVKLGMRLS